MASIFKNEPMTYRVDSSWMSGRGTTATKLKRAGYLSATPVYGPVYQKKWQRSSKTKPTRDIIGYDAQIMTKVEYTQPQPQVQPQVQQIAKEAPKVETPGTGANRGAVGSLGTASGAGVAGSAQAGLVGSVNTEVQNDDMLLPYQKV
jgi:hypothetical protein